MNEIMDEEEKVYRYNDNDSEDQIIYRDAKKRFINVGVLPQLNRSVINYTNVGNCTPYFNILFNVRSSALHFTTNMEGCKNIKINIYRNLTNCKFAQDYLDLVYSGNKNDNYKSCLSDVKEDKKDLLNRSIYEKYEFFENSPGKENMLKVYGWKFIDSPDDYFVAYAERRYYNPLTRLNIIKTGIIQFSTVEGLEILNT